MQQVADHSSERRKYPRVKSSAEVALKSTEKDSTIFGWVQNISLGGFKTRLDTFPGILKLLSLGIGKKVLFETFQAPLELKGRGEIRWISSNDVSEAGIKFDELDDKSRKSLDAFLENASVKRK